MASQHRQYTPSFATSLLRSGAWLLPQIYEGASCIARHCRSELAVTVDACCKTDVETCLASYEAHTLRRTSKA